MRLVLALLLFKTTTHDTLQNCDCSASSEGSQIISCIQNFISETFMAQPDPQNERTERLEVDMLDVKTSLNRLIDYSVESDRRLTKAIEGLVGAQTQTLQLVDRLQDQVTEMQSEVRGMQTENRRIWEILSRQQGNENS